jgi:CO/xanthine dehydrogenase FAD-binding subunit
VKPAPFAYDAPEELGEVLALLAEHGDDAMLLAGGQSLMPLLNLRLAQPARLIDLNRVAGLAFVRADDDGALRIGATARQRALETSTVAGMGWPLLADALGWVAHPAIRNRGTVGGSLAHADPAGELAVACAALDARLHLRSHRGTRTVGWRDFWLGYYTTCRQPDELLVEIELPALATGTGWAFAEYARRHGDFALGGAAVLVSTENGRCREARIALLGAGDRPLRAEAAERALAGTTLDAASAAEIAELAVAEIDPAGDAIADGDYRRRLIAAMVRRALLEAGGRADG